MFLKYENLYHKNNLEIVAISWKYHLYHIVL